MPNWPFVKAGETVLSFIEPIIRYLQKAWEGTKPIWAFLIATANYLLFPDRAFATLLACVLGAAVLDILTRWYALGRSRTGKLSSRAFWDGTSTKIVSYLVIAILAGMSYRMAPFLQQSAIYLWSVAYAVMFLREAQSVIENLCDAGANLQWLLLWTKRKERQILEADEMPAAIALSVPTEPAKQLTDGVGWEEP